MFNQIRTMLGDNGNLEGSSVEIDETYIDGRRRGKRGCGAEGESIIVGAAERRGRILAQKVPDVKARTLVPFVERTVVPKSMVYPDDLPSYDAFRRMGYTHKRVPHALKVYVIGDIHTNSMEDFWSLVKRGISGVYHAVSDKYVQNYVNEYSFRYNRRKNGGAMFEAFPPRIVASGQDG